MTVTATWGGATIATSDATEVVEGNHYFPEADVDRSVLEPTQHRTTCPWKGEASYYHVVVGGQRNDNAAWYYPEPKPGAEAVAGRVAFWKGVEVQ